MDEFSKRCELEALVAEFTGMHWDNVASTTIALPAHPNERFNELAARMRALAVPTTREPRPGEIDEAMSRGASDSNKHSDLKWLQDEVDSLKATVVAAENQKKRLAAELGEARDGWKRCAFTLQGKLGSAEQERNAARAALDGVRHELQSAGLPACDTYAEAVHRLVRQRDEARNEAGLLKRERDTARDRLGRAKSELLAADECRTRLEQLLAQAGTKA